MTDRIASYRWDAAEIGELLQQLSASMSAEIDLLVRLDAPAAEASEAVA